MKCYCETPIKQKQTTQMTFYHANQYSHGKKSSGLSTTSYAEHSDAEQSSAVVDL